MVLHIYIDVICNLPNHMPRTRTGHDCEWQLKIMGLRFLVLLWVTDLCNIHPSFQSSASSSSSSPSSSPIPPFKPLFVFFLSLLLNLLERNHLNPLYYSLFDFFCCSIPRKISARRVSKWLSDWVWLPQKCKWWNTLPFFIVSRQW